MQTLIFILFLIPIIVHPYSRLCSSCPTYGCCNVWRQCSSQLADCAYYVGSTSAQSEIGQPCLDSTECVSQCCSNYVCSIESACPLSDGSSLTTITSTMTCDSCSAGCCDHYWMCAADTSQCVYYVGDVSNYVDAADIQDSCYDAQCSTGCCVGNLCAESPDECSWPNWKIFIFGCGIFLALLFTLIACTVRYLYNDKKKALYQEARQMILNKQIVGPKGRDPIANLVQHPNKIIYSASNSIDSTRSKVYEI
jgi:cbb3-type cytochrome oxidase subunit 3